MKQLFLIILTWIFLLGAAFSEENKLIFVEILLRHGDRAPTHLYSNDPNPISLWSDGLGALTALGKKQHYALGKYFRTRYDNFATSSPLEVNVISSGTDRCLMSAEANVASFYAPDHKWSFENNLPWQPIAVHCLSKNQDYKYFALSYQCSRVQEELQKINESPEVQRFLKKHEEMFRNLSILSGDPMTNWKEIYLLQDVLFTEKEYNLSVPSWVEPYWNELTDVINWSYYLEFNSPLMHRLRAGPFIQRVIERMKQKMDGEIPDLKFQIYSAHGITIAAVLNALNLYNMIKPPFSSALLFELFEMPDGVKTVRMLYQNSSKPEYKIDPPQILILEGCTEFCPLDYFIEYTSPLIPEDWERECQLDKTFIEKVRDYKISIGWLLILLAVVLVIISILLLRRMYSRRQNKKGIYAVKYQSLAGS